MPYLNAQITTQAIIKNDQGEILLLKRNKPGGWFTLPGGTVDEKESIIDALTREIFEETALKLKIDRPVWVWQSNHIGKDLIGIVFAVDKKIPEDSPIVLSKEHNEFKWFSFDDLMKDPAVDPYIKKDALREL